MRPQLLRFLQRAPAGLSKEGMQALRAGLTSGEASGLLQASSSNRNEVPLPKGLGFSKMAMPLSLQGHLMSTLATANGEDKKESTTAALAREVPKVPTALAALPPRRSMGTAAHGHELSAKETYIEHIAKRHPFHVLPPSPWPLLAGWGTLVMALGAASWFHNIPGGGALLALGVGNLTWTAITWWRDCVIEGDMGMHTEIVRKNMQLGMWCFITNEAMLFSGLLWACIDLGMSPSTAMQCQWPPVGIEPIGWDKRALVMSAVLAASYYSANVAMVAKEPKTVLAALGTTIGLGAMFTYDQYLEYNETPFTITDSPYGTTFFVTTGFHGLHVIIGSIYLAAAMAMYARSNVKGAALTSSILYWHFVDIVWIAVYGIIYVGQF